jgi:hypothetical protein
MGGSKVPGSPHWLANEYQRNNRHSGKSALQVARGSLFAAGCAKKDVDRIMKEFQNYADNQGWSLP